MIEVNKLEAVRPVTYKKDLMTLRLLTELAPNQKICELDKQTYQSLINEYARIHQKQTTMDFYNHLKSVILDAVDEGILTSNSTRKAIIKGKPLLIRNSNF